MFLVTVKVYDGAGDVIAERSQPGETADFAFLPAEAFGKGALKRTDDPDAYAQYEIERLS